MKKTVLKNLGLAAIAVFIGSSSVSAQNKVFTEPDDGITVIEAENYFSLKEGTGEYASKYWSLATENSDYTGVGYMVAPDGTSGIGDGADALETAPTLTFKVNFTQTGVHYWAARVSYADGASDSYHLGLADTLWMNKMNPWSEIEENYDSWGWNMVNASGGEAVFNVPTIGEHEIVVILREPNFRIDKIVIATDIGELPEGLDEEGPDETPFTAVGIKESKFSNSLSLYPNPVANQTTISFDVLKPGNVQVSVLDVTGKVVDVLMNADLATGTQQVVWNVADGSNVNPGVYFVKVNNAGSLAVRKIVVQ